MPGGRPPKLEQIVDRVPVLHPETREPTGEMRDVTMIEHLTSDLRVGMPVHRAAKRAGITSETFYEWEKVAGRARARVVAGLEPDELPEYDRLCVVFSDAVNAAELEWEARSNAELERLARGGIEQEKVREKVVNGDVVERVTTRSVTLPDAQVLLTRLKLRFPKDYSDRVVIAGEGKGGAIPVEVRASELAAAARRFRASSPGGRRRARRRLRSARMHADSPEPMSGRSGPRGALSEDG